MITLRHWVGMLFSIVGVLVIAGCQDGIASHNVSAETDGTLDGLVISPNPQELGIDTGSDFLLDWRPGYVPPAQFQVSLVSVASTNTTSAVYTRLKSTGTGHYRLVPSMPLPGQQFYLLEVDGAGQTVRAIYLTGGLPGIPLSTAAPNGQARHLIHTR